MTVYVVVPKNTYLNKDCMAGIYYSENAALQNGHPYRSFPDLEEAYMYIYSKSVPSDSKWTLCNRTHLYTLNTPITETTKTLAEMLKESQKFLCVLKLRHTVARRQLVPKLSGARKYK